MATWDMYSKYMCDGSFLDLRAATPGRDGVEIGSASRLPVRSGTWCINESISSPSILVHFNVSLHPPIPLADS